MDFKIIKHHSAQYDQMVTLRYEVLRKPLGLTFSEEDLNSDKDNILLAACNPDSDEVAACCILSPINEHTVQLKQMAVADSCRGKGTGRELIAYAESISLERHFKYIYLHARKTATDFYKKQGYDIQGELFYEVGIPHFEMIKKL